MALKQYFYIVLVPLKFIPKRTASFWQTIKIPNRFVLKICTGGFADYTLPTISHAENENIFLNTLLSKLQENLHSTKCFLQYQLYMTAEEVLTNKMRKA